MDGVSTGVRSLAAFRVALLVLAALLIAVSGNLPRLLPALFAMIVVQVVASLPLRLVNTPAAAVAEALGVVLVATVPDPASGNLMLCLLAPALAAGIRGGFRWVMTVVIAAAAAGTALILRAPGEFDNQSLVDLYQWCVLAAATGMTAAWYVRQAERGDPTRRSYEAAVRALSELSEISRRLPSGLDVPTIAGTALSDAIAAAGADCGVAITFGRRGSLDTAAALPEGSTDWLRRVGSLSEWGELAHNGEAVHRRTADGEVALQPITAGNVCIAFLLVRSTGDLAERQMRKLEAIAAKHAVPLQAALLFADVRYYATSEERSRIAREIHDGIAQDVAFLGYAADEIISSAEDPATIKLATELRSEISRVVGELRMSVFSLRESAAPAESLGTTIAGYARRVFEDSLTAVHVTTNESPHRLRPDVDAELVRMAQEALTNARRHASAANVWITCTVDAPTATILIEDDGRGMGQRRHDSYGLQIMHERAGRIGADVTITERPSGGTRIELVV